MKEIDILLLMSKTYDENQSIMKIDILREVSTKYLIARKEFLDVANETEELSGNDNIIGRIGEFIAYQFLSDRNPRKNENISEKGFDIICDQNTRVSVKTITSENKAKRTTRIKEPWDELMVIELGEKGIINRIGQLTKEEFLKALSQNRNFGNEPFCKLTMLNPNGLIGRYGKVLSHKEIKSKAWL